MSGPVTEQDVAAVPTGEMATSARLEILASRTTAVAGVPVRRALPLRVRRSIGHRCFVDHVGPTAASFPQGMSIGPHPHIGLQTVTWLVAGELLHRDSLGSEQLVRPGELNLMTAGSGVAHAEESVENRGALHGVQMWVAQPDATRFGPAEFEHHGELPRVALASGDATVLVGTFGKTSPARRDSDHVAVDLDLHRGKSVLSTDPGYEYGLVVLEGEVVVADRAVTPGNLGYLGSGRDELVLSAETATRALLLGGVPPAEPLLMWWNFVGRTREEMVAAYAHWQSEDERFGSVNSTLPRVPAPSPPWLGGDQRH